MTDYLHPNPGDEIHFAITFSGGKNHVWEETAHGKPRWTLFLVEQDLVTGANKYYTAWHESLIGLEGIIELGQARIKETVKTSGDYRFLVHRTWCKPILLQKKLKAETTNPWLINPAWSVPSSFVSSLGYTIVT